MSIGQSMFGDMFQSRGEYTTGLFYAGRMKYIHSTPKSTAGRATTAPLVPSSTLQPPTDFMTIRQRRDFLRLERGGTHSAGFQRLEFKKLTEAEDRPGKGPLGKGIVHNQSKTITIQKYPSVDPRDWREERQAGCTFYVHKETGEATTEKPWEDTKKGQINKRDINERKKEEEDSECMGTGSLVYDGTELNYLLKQLDGRSKVMSHPQTDKL